MLFIVTLPNTEPTFLHKFHQFFINLFKSYTTTITHVPVIVTVWRHTDYPCDFTCDSMF